MHVIPSLSYINIPLLYIYNTDLSIGKYIIPPIPTSVQNWYYSLSLTHSQTYILYVYVYTAYIYMCMYI